MAKESVTPEIFLIGGSAGALEVLLQVLPELKPSLLFPLIIILHRKTDTGSSLEDLLNSICRLPVKEIEDKEKLLPGNIYISPADYHVLIEKDGTLSLDISEKVNFCRPSIDVTFESAVAAFQHKVAGLVLSGANMDGTSGIIAIHNAGGLTYVQSPDEASVSFMPQNVLDHTRITAVLNTSGIAGTINSL